MAGLEITRAVQQSLRRNAWISNTESWANAYSDEGAGFECAVTAFPHDVWERSRHSAAFRSSRIRRILHPRRGIAKSCDPIETLRGGVPNVAAVQDQTVIFALSWIAKNASRKLSLDAVACASGCSRQRLEVRFRAAIGRTVMQEVRRTRIETAKSLLVSSTATLAEIAKRSGFADAASLSVSFRREKGVSPGEYRRRVDGRDAEE